MEKVTLILLIIGSITLIMSVASFVIGVIVIKKQKEMSEFFRSERTQIPMEYQKAMVRAESNNTGGYSKELKKYGIIICDKCYTPVPETVKVCPHCQKAIDRR